MITYKFAALIISHGRPNNIPTISALTRAGYSGDIYIIIDNEDSHLHEYIDIYGDKVIIFDKQCMIDNNLYLFNKINMRNVAVHARNACEHIAKKLKLDYFFVLDDDIINFHYRFVSDKLHRSKLCNLDDGLNCYIQYMIESNIACIGLAHEGVFLGGLTTIFTQPYHSRNRILANAFIRNANFEVVWGPDMCEDFITSINENCSGNLYMTLPFIGISCRIQGMNKKKHDGGNSEAYIDLGNYGVAVYSVLALPSMYEIIIDKKLWFKCKSYENIVPKIISSKYKVGD